MLLLSTTTGYQLRSFGESAARLGLELTLGTDRCHHLDDPWRDGAIAVRFFDDEASLAAIRAAHEERPFRGVIAVGDRPALLAARAAESLRLPGNPIEAAAATTNKKLMRQTFAACGLPVPWFFELTNDADVRAAAARVRYPCVVKPLGLSGSRGVIRADTERQFEYAVDRVRKLLARPQVRAMRAGLEYELLIEGFIEGHEYAIEGLITRGELRVLAIFDKPDPLDGPFFEETIYVTLAEEATRQVQHAIADAVQRATAALGLVHGPVHAECRVGPAGVTLLEVAARPIGGLCSKVLRFTAGGETLPLEELLLRHASGEEVTPYMREGVAAGVMMIPIPKRGVLKTVLGEGSARAVPHVEEIRITARPDQLLEPLPEGDSYLGFIFARAAQPADVVAALRESHRRLAFQIEPEIRVER
jgi:biotin carboxylase